MKIAIVIPSLALKAPVIVARDLADGFLSSGHSVHVYYFDEIVEIDFPCAVDKISFLDFNKFNDFDVIHTHLIRPDFFGWLCRFFGSYRGYLVTTIHNIVEEDLSFAYGKLISLIFSRLWRGFWMKYDGRVVLTGQALKYYSASQPNLLFTRIYNGRACHSSKPIDLGDYEKIVSFKKDRRLIGACAVVSRRKGLEQIISALPFLTDYAFLLVGDGPALDELKDLSRKLSVDNRFLCVGVKNNARDYLQFMDVYAMPSRSEGLPLALLEAVEANVPIVCSDIEQFREIFSEKEAAYFILDDIGGLSSAIRYLEHNGDCFIKNAKLRLYENYTQQVMVKNYLELFQKNII
jgi:glycosyltransferase involved in cell wall biosynthesis